MNLQALGSDLDQHSLAAHLFKAIRSRDNSAVIRLAPEIHSLDGHLDPEYSETPLASAARHDLSAKAIGALLPRSDPLLKGFGGSTPLILVSHGSAPDSAEVARLLLPVSDPLAVRDDGCSALDIAIFACNADIVSLLLPVSDLSCRGSGKGSTLDQTTRWSNKDVASLVRGEMARRESIELSAVALNARPIAARASRL